MSPDERRKYEERLARALGSVNSLSRRDILKLLGDPPQLDNLTEEVWRVIEDSYRGIITPELEQVYMVALEWQQAQVGVGVAWDLVNERAVNWAQTYGYELVDGITRTSQRQVSNAVRAFYEDPATDLKEVTRRLSNTFGPQRAESIAITEVTRAASEGAQAYHRELTELGVQTLPIWQTAHDDLVCPICGPRHEKVIERGEYPPAHPRCRCWVSQRVQLPA